MKNLIIYRIITYILLFVAAFLSVGVFTSLLAALSNPVALLPLFLLACIIIYSYSSWRFLVRGIDKNIPCKITLRDLIKVNGYITLGLASLCLFQMIVVLTQPGMINSILEQVKAAQPAGQQMTEEVLLKWTHFTLRFLMAYSSLLIIHTILTFRLVKRYPEVFEPPAK
ncbi:MAG TPA: hypothetical protein VK625_03795 [Flavitalea sp.]|nr:hypothetical protein [Flavitalea sp.]